MNKFRNERIIKLDGTEILLRATFNNLAKTESELGSIAGLAAKISMAKENSESQSPISLIVKFFFFNQADDNKTIYTLDELYFLVLDEGYQSARLQMLQFFVLLTAGKKANKVIAQKEIDRQLMQAELEKKTAETIAIKK